MAVHPVTAVRERSITIKWSKKVHIGVEKIIRAHTNETDPEMKQALGWIATVVKRQLKQAKERKLRDILPSPRKQAEEWLGVYLIHHSNSKQGRKDVKEQATPE